MTDYVTIKQCAAFLGVPRSTVYSWCIRGWLGAEFVAGRWLIRREALTVFLRGPHAHRVRAA